MKILVHTLDSHAQYLYFRQKLYLECGGQHEIVFLVQREKEKTHRTLKERLKAEQKLVRISRKRGEFFTYFVNRLLAVFLSKYKRVYDVRKLGVINKHFDSRQDKNLVLPKTFYIENINDEKQRLIDIAPDLMVVFGGPYIRPHILDVVNNVINIHLGYLPDYRGIKSIEWAVLNGEFEKVAYTIHQMTTGLDRGLILFREQVDIGDRSVISFGAVYTTLYEKAFNRICTYVNAFDSPSQECAKIEKGSIYNNYRMGPLHYRKLNKMTERKKLAIFAGNPVQYHAPIYRSLEQSGKVDLTVLFGSNIGAEKFYSKEFNADIKWDVPVLDGYKSIIFSNLARRNWKGFFSRMNFSMFFHIVLNRYDTVLIHGYDTFSSWLVFFGAKISGAKIVWRGEAIIRPQNQKNVFKNFIKHTVLPRYFKSCDAIAYSCTANKDYLQQFGIAQDKMFFVPCSVDNDFFQSEKKTATNRVVGLRATLGIDQSDLVLLYVARMTSRKRPHDLINAVALVESKHITILFVGDGPERNSLEDLANDAGVKTVFVGFQGQKALAKYYMVADVFMMLAEYDASPKALNEALNFNLPVIASNTVGTARDLVINDFNGYVIDSGDLAGIGKKINALDKDRSMTRALGLNSGSFLKFWSAEQDAKGIIEAIVFASST